MFCLLSKWKDAPVNVINDFQSIYLQTVPTLTFKKFRGGSNLASTVCRLCSQGQESVKHLLSNCTKFTAHAYKRRHDRVLQYIMFKYLHKMNMISDFPAWYSKISIKPHYETDEIEVYWDIPEYSGYSEDASEHGPLRPDGKIINKTMKTIFVLEMSVPWIENRNTKLEEKESKYMSIVQNLRVSITPDTIMQSNYETTSL